VPGEWTEISFNLDPAVAPWLCMGGRVDEPHYGCASSDAEALRYIDHIGFINLGVPPDPDGNNSASGTVQIDHVIISRPPTVVHQVPVENVIWTNAVGVTPSGNSLSKPGGGSSDFNAGASSTRAIGSGDGFVEFTAPESTTDRIVGLGMGDPNQALGDVDYGIRLTTTGSYQIYFGGADTGKSGSYAAGDRFHVGIEAGMVRYYRQVSTGWLLLHEAAASPVYPLRVDTSFSTPGGTITNVVIGGALQNAGP
jgi:hypothetical protein